MTKKRNFIFYLLFVIFVSGCFSTKVKADLLKPQTGADAQLISSANQQTPNTQATSPLQASPLLDNPARSGSAYPDMPQYSDMDEIVYDGTNPDVGNTYTVYVSTPNAFLEAVYDDQAPGGVSHIDHIILKNNLDLSNAGVYGFNGGSYSYDFTRHFKLTIDGAGYTLNFGHNSIALKGNNSGLVTSNLYKEDWTLKDVNLFSSSYWGPIAGNSGNSQNVDLTDNAAIQAAGGYTQITYDNVNYVGSQTHNSLNNQGTTAIVIKNRVSLSSVQEYKYHDQVYTTDSDGNQQIFEASRITFDKNSHFSGYTYNGNGIELTGPKNSVVLKDGAQVYLYPHGQSGENSSFGYVENHNYALVMHPSDSNATSSIDLYGNSQLNIISNDAPAKGQYSDGTNALRSTTNLAGAIYVSGTSSIHFHKEASGSPIIRLQSNDQSTMDYQTDANNLLDDQGNIKDTSAQAVGDATSYASNHGADYGKYITPDSPNAKSTLNHSLPLVDLNGGNITLDHGTFDVQSNNLHDFGGSGTNLNPRFGNLMRIGSKMNITIKKDGVFKLHETGTNQTGNSMNLLDTDAGLNLNIYNPKEIMLDLGNNDSDNAHLVNVEGGSDSSSGGDVIVQNTTFSAQGNPSPITGPEKPLGTANSPKLNLDNVPVQRIDVPFTYWAIPATLFQSGDKQIYAKQADLMQLNQGLSIMNGKEFHKIVFGKLGSPTITNHTAQIIPHQDASEDMHIKGSIQPYSDDTKESFNPTPPLMHLVLNRLGQQYDLGTVTNSQQAYGIKNANTILPVTPGMLLADDQGVQDGVADPDNLGSLVDSVDAIPQYVADTAIQWTPDTKDSTVQNYDIDLQKVLTNYNQLHPTAHLEFNSSDTLQLSAVSNFQETPKQTIGVTNLSLGIPDKVDQYLIGDTVKVPLTYFDGDATANKISITGQVNDGRNVDLQKHIAITSHKEPIKDSSWQIDNITNQADSDTSTHQLQFRGQDDASPTNDYPLKKEDQATYQYKVLPFPKYSVTKTVKKINKGQNTISRGANHLQTTFKPVGQHSLDTVQFKLGSLTSNSTVATTNPQLTITAKTPDDQKSIQVAKNSKDTYTLTGKDFGFSDGQIPANTTFTVEQPLQVIGKNNSRLTGHSDQLLAVAADKSTHLLGQSKILNYLITEPDIELDVPQQLGFSVILKHQNQTIFSNTPSATAKLTNHTKSATNVSLLASFSGNKTLAPLIYYQTSKSAAALADPATIFTGTLTANQKKDIQLNPSTATQQGLALKIPANDTALKPGSQGGTLTWTVQNSLQ